MAQIAGFFKLLALFWNNGDKIASLMTTLVNQLPVIGQQLITAGNLMTASSQALVGGGPLPFNAQQGVNSAAGALGVVASKLIEVETTVQSIRSDLNSVKVPLLAKSEVQFPVLNGAPLLVTDKIPILAVTDGYPFAGPASTLDTTYMRLVDIETGITTTKDGLTGLSDALGQIGSDLNQTGALLVQVGQIFIEMNTPPE